MAGHGPRDVVTYNWGKGKCAVQVSHIHLPAVSPTARCASIPEISKHNLSPELQLTAKRSECKIAIPAREHCSSVNMIDIGTTSGPSSS